jgi:transposase InsO family protein
LWTIEAFLLSARALSLVLEQLLDALPFVIKGFHSDNGSEYINKRVAKLLEKLLIEFTKRIKPGCPLGWGHTPLANY